MFPGFPLYAALSTQYWFMQKVIQTALPWTVSCISQCSCFSCIDRSLRFVSVLIYFALQILMSSAATKNPSQFSENMHSTLSHTCNNGSSHLSSRKQSLAYAVWRVISSYTSHSTDLCMKMGSVAKYLYVTLHKIKFLFSCFAVYCYVCAALMQAVLHHLSEQSLHTWQVKELRC